MKKNRSSKLLHEVVSAFLNQNFPLENTSIFITLTKVNLSPDGATAKIFLSLLPLGKEESEVIQKKCKELMVALQKETREMKRYIAIHLCRKLRKIPEIYLVWDLSGKKASQIIKVISKVEKDSSGVE